MTREILDWRYFPSGSGVFIIWKSMGDGNLTQRNLYVQRAAPAQQQYLSLPALPSEGWVRECLCQWRRCLAAVGLDRLP